MKNGKSNVEIFTSLYKELEEALKNRGIKNGRSSMVMQFISSPEGKMFKEDLNTCREMRNILSHCPDIDGEPPLIPSDSAINALRKVIEYLSAPPLAIDRAKCGEELVCAKLSSPVTAIMNKMIRLGYSHIPVFENGMLYGVFSISTVFSKALYSAGDPVTENTLIRDFAEYLAVDKHVCESFLFAPYDTTLPEAEAMFDNPSGPEHKRIAAIFITKNGSPKERILGMLTPWDVFGDE